MDNASEKSDERTTPAAHAKVVLAGGCFWGMEELLRELPGVVGTDVGYCGGARPDPTYEQVCTGVTGHAESVQVEYDPQVLTLADLLRFFFRIHDPTTLNRQGGDRGTQYRSAIFLVREEDRAVAETICQEVKSSGLWRNPLTTEIRVGAQFYRAEDYHQDYLQKNPGGYTCHYVR